MNAQSRSKSITVRFLAVIALIVGLMIPTLLVNFVVGDRESYYRQALDDIATSWAAEQLIAGPMLAIPYTAASADGTKTRSSLILIMPELLDAEISSTHEYRRRGIFEAPVLTAHATLSGLFAPVQFDELEARFGTLKADQAGLIVGVSDARGIGAAAMGWNGTALAPSGASGVGATRDGILASLAQAEYEEGGEFTVTLSLRFVGRLGAMLIGDRSHLEMTSDWPHPSFDGRFLPDAHTVTDEGFRATWSSNALARGYRSIVSDYVWDIEVRHPPGGGYASLSLPNEPQAADRDSVGFSVFEPVTLYTSVSRALKYGVMFIVLTLVSVLCIELVTGNRLHIVQYGVVGIGLVLFFLLLLSLAEHIGFGRAYLAATCVLTGMIAGYAWLVTRTGATTAVIGAILILLYGSLYAILQLEQYSLLVGTALLVVLLGALMVATRGLHREAERPEAKA